VRWRVRASDARPAVTAARRGFETTLRVDGRPPRVRVEALDASGAVLGNTARVAVRHAER
jgi:hypothetical protein